MNWLYTLGLAAFAGAVIWNRASRERERWYGVDLQIGMEKPKALQARIAELEAEVARLRGRRAWQCNSCERVVIRADVPAGCNAPTEDCDCGPSAEWEEILQGGFNGK